jgi:hypothetical protein
MMPTSIDVIHTAQMVENHKQYVTHAASMRASMPPLFSRAAKKPTLFVF